MATAADNIDEFMRNTLLFQQKPKDAFDVGAKFLNELITSRLVKINELNGVVCQLPLEYALLFPK
jgi:hypothetical protein